MISFSFTIVVATVIIISLLIRHHTSPADVIIIIIRYRYYAIMPLRHQLSEPPDYAIIRHYAITPFGHSLRITIIIILF